MIKLLKKVALRIREALPINRVVTLLAPVFATAAGYIASWAAANLPGLPPIDPSWLAGIFAAGAAAGLAAVYKWLDGWQKHEARIASYVEADLRGGR